jgi:DNA-binding MarR family transcriptional regulator
MDSTTPRATRVRANPAISKSYAPRGGECAYANLKLVARVLNTLYDDALRPVDLRAGQLALMWAILALEPVEYGKLSVATLTDQTTLSRTVAKLRKARLVRVQTGRDGRVRLLTLTPAGRQRFEEAMPLWEEAQRRAAAFVPLSDARALARRVRKSTRATAQS